MQRSARMAIAVAIVVAVLAGRHYSQSPERPADAVATAVPAAREPAKPRTWQLGSLTLRPCELEQPHSGLSTAAWCAPFEVPENREEPGGRKIGLRLAVIRSSAQVPAKDMIVFLAGGPGQAATESYPAIAPAMAPLLAHRNVLLVDQRGTGGSHPLSCRDDGDTGAHGGPDDSTAFDVGRLRRETETCLKELSKDADVRFYTTTDAVADLEDVRKALGSPAFDVIGVSYGTRVAQQYAHRHRDAVRTMVLDGVAPNELILGEDFAVNLDAALKAQFARCAADKACSERFTDPYQTLYQLRDALRANPHKVTFRDPQNYSSVQRVLSEHSLATVVRMFAYSPETAALLPLSIDAAARGDVGPLLGQAKLLTGDLGDTMDGGMQYSVICSEDADLLKPRPQDADTILGDTMIEAFRAACSIWPHGRRPADFHEPLRSDVPTLLMSGEFDPVTPPRYGDQVAKGLANAKHVVLKGQGHNVIARGCMPRVLDNFVDKAQPASLDTSCLERMGPIPVFVGFNGATP
ncbi:pimeloyl-ACP methyl ester carboxylesterase [Luteibacter rhizovicinus]|uniref:Pimeloyl-ACP methyl ester carboxylesterase n=1 Tax=Luteibacter rhizovicinus TaxID=242606 RepID=A0A4R3YJA2_9GAMM|nr:alpha/beta hydrolase [Luteibacter rhizovicinus]TCV92306.1 pimeloyl-ACP methyl ester carboxylesterase [Luteibacter rhizovicinus]